MGLFDGEGAYLCVCERRGEGAGYPQPKSLRSLFEIIFSSPLGAAFGVSRFDCSIVVLLRMLVYKTSAFLIVYTTYLERKVRQDKVHSSSHTNGKPLPNSFLTVCGFSKGFFGI